MVAPSPLLELPGELRNRIYGYVLVDDIIKLDSTGHTEPELLHTCKQVRKEAIRIYYAENRFEILVPDYDSSLLLQWSRKAVQLALDHNVYVVCRIFCQHHPQPDWPKLLLWLERVFANSIPHSCRHPPSQAPSGTSVEGLVVGGMFHLVRTSQNQPWDYVKKLLEEQRLILIALDGRWK